MTSAESHENRIRRLQESVAILLRFAAESVGKTVDAGLVARVAPLLRREPASLSVDDEVSLWKDCDVLTQVVKPTTLEAAKVALDLAEPKSSGWLSWWCSPVRRRNIWWIAGTGLLLCLFIAAQAYTLAVGSALAEIGRVGDELSAKTMDAKLLSANGGGSSAAQDENERRIMNLTIRLESTQMALERMVKPTMRLLQARPPESVKEFTGQNAEKARSAPGNDMGSLEQLKRNAVGSNRTYVEIYGRVTHEVMIGYVIPLILGLLGAYAYVTRQISLAVKNNTYQKMAALLDRVRVVQGATFGTLAGVLAGVIQVEPSASSVSIPAVALICGYNSDMVFRAMDSAGLKFKNYLAAQTPSPPSRTPPGSLPSSAPAPTPTPTGSPG